MTQSIRLSQQRTGSRRSTLCFRVVSLQRGQDNCRTEGRVDEAKYGEILSENLFPQPGQWRWVVNGCSSMTMTQSIRLRQHRTGSRRSTWCFRVVSLQRGQDNCRTEGRVDETKYWEILSENLLTSARTVKMGRGGMFQYDNDPKHTAKATKDWVKKKYNKVMEWPSQSQDLDLLQNLWRELKIWVAQWQPTNLKDLEKICKEECPPPRICKNTVTNYSKLLAAVLSNKGFFHQVLNYVMGEIFIFSMKC